MAVAIEKKHEGYRLASMPQEIVSGTRCPSVKGNIKPLPTERQVWTGVFGIADS